MTNAVKSFIPVLELLKNLSLREKTHYLKTANPKLVKFLSDICYNILLNTLKPSEELLRTLKPNRSVIEKLGKRGLSLKERRKILARKNLFDKIFVPLIPCLIDHLSSP